MSEQKGPEPSVTMSGSCDEVTDEAVLGGLPVPWSTLNAPFLCVTLCVLSHRKTALWIIYSVTTLYIFKVCTFN